MTAVAAAWRTVVRGESRADVARQVAIVLLFGLGGASIGLACWSLAVGGIGWDSRLDTLAALEVRKVDTSWSLAQAYDAVPATSEFYGIFPYQFADFLHLLTTGSTAGLGADSSGTYLYEGAANLILSVVSVSALAVALGLALRSLLAGALVWSLTLATPLWLGMSHLDFKDMPVAAGLTLVTSGLVLGLVTRPPRRATIAGALLAGAGGAIVLSTRAGAIVLLLALVGGTAVVLLAWGLGLHRLRATLPALIAGASALVCAVVFTWATNPIARIDMLQWLTDSIDFARAYPWDSGPIRVAGKDFRSYALPWWYVPAWLGAQLPLLTITTIVGGACVIAVALVRRRRWFGVPSPIALAPIGLQAVALPIAIVASGAVLYDGVRHLLFILPALIAVAATGFALLDQAFGARPRLRALVALGAVATVATSLWGAIVWAPYSYAYLNPIAGHDKDGRSWELDYWGTSAREGISRLRKLGFATIYVEPTAMVGVPFGAVNDHVRHGPRTGLYVFLRWADAADYGCSVLFTIKRDGHVLGEGARCPPEAQG